MAEQSSGIEKKTERVPLGCPGKLVHARMPEAALMGHVFSLPLGYALMTHRLIRGRRSRLGYENPIWPLLFNAYRQNGDPALHLYSCVLPPWRHAGDPEPASYRAAAPPLKGKFHWL